MPLSRIVKEPIDLEPLFPDRTSEEPIGAQLVRRLRNAIETGFFPPSSRLLPSRELAQRLGVARNTVTYALDQLIAEGYLEARVGDGTYVTATVHLNKKRPPATSRVLPVSARAIASTKARLDEVGTSVGPLRVGSPSLTEFPLHTWQRLARVHLANAGDFLDYGQSSGLLALREAISRHIAQFRGVVADPEQISIVEGTQGALQLVASILATSGDAIVVEDPCYVLARSAFVARGLSLRPIDVDDEGIRTNDLPDAAALAYVTPSHQFPLGGALPRERRAELLAWARKTGAYVVEDDYDSEFDAHPLPALQSLDRDERVIYVGTFSKTLAPGLRIGYVVVPPHLAEVFRLARAIGSLGSSAELQATLADFIAQGHFSRHVRRMTGIYERRRRIVIEAFAGLPSGFKIGPAQTGLHVSVMAPPDFDDARAANALPNGWRVLPLSAMCIKRTDCKGLVMGFSAGSDAEVSAAATALGRVFRQDVLFE